MNKVVSFQEAALLRGLKRAAATGPSAPGHDEEVSNARAGQPEHQEVRLSFEWEDGGEPMRIPVSLFVDVSLGNAPVSDLPEEVVRLVLGQWAMARLRALRETGQ